MNNKNLTNILQIPLTFEPNQNSIDFQISAKDYAQYMVINPKVSTFMSWINVSDEINNNKIRISNGDAFTPTTEDAVKIALKTRKSYYKYDDPETAQIVDVNCFNQGLLINPQLNCFTNNTFLWSQNENYIYNNDGSFNSYFFDPSNFESGSITNGGNTPSLTRIRQKNKYIVNGPLFLYLLKSVDSLKIAFWAIEVYNGAGSYQVNLSINWTPISTNPTTVGVLLNNIPFNQKYSVRFVFKSNIDSIYNSPIDLNELINKDLIDVSNASKYIFSEPIATKKDNFYIPFSNFAFNYTFNIYKYDQEGNYLSMQTHLNPGSGVQVNTAGIGFIILSLFSPDNLNLSFNGSTSPSTPTTSGISNRTIAQNWIKGINFFQNNDIVSNTIIIPDGYYSGIASSATQTGFSFIMDLFNNNTFFQSFNGLLELNQLNFKTRFSGQVFIEFLGSSNRIFGFYNKNEIFVDTIPSISEDPIDLFSDGRFSQINLILSNLGSNGYINESNSLITISASSNYGSLIKENDISYKKLLPRTANLNTLSIRIVDGFNLPIKLNDRLFLRFEILCYNE